MRLAVTTRWSFGQIINELHQQEVEQLTHDASGSYVQINPLWMTISTPTPTATVPTLPRNAMTTPSGLPCESMSMSIQIGRGSPH